MNTNQFQNGYVGSTQVKEVRRGTQLVAAPNGDSLWYKANSLPSLDLRFSTNKNLIDSVSNSNKITFTRASSGTYVGSDGLIKTATTNEARFDHNPTTGESLGLLVEEQRTNLLLQSAAFNSSNWVKGGLTVTADQEVSPDGTQTADVCTLTSSGHALYAFVTVTASTTYTFSFYVKRGTGTTAVYAITNDSAGGASIVSNTNYYAQTSASAWSRVSVTFNTPVGCTSIGVFLQRDSGSSSGTMFFWGAQLEAGSFPTSYIPTTSATVTRSADVASITGANFSSWYRQDEGTVFLRYSFPQSPNTGGARGLVITNSTGTNLIWLRAQAGVNRIYDVTNSSVSQANFNQGTYTAGVDYRAALAVKANDFGFAENGGNSASDTSGTMPSLDRLGLGVDPSGTSSGNVHIRRFTYWPSRLPNSTLQEITR